MAQDDIVDVFCWIEAPLLQASFGVREVDDRLSLRKVALHTFGVLTHVSLDAQIKDDALRPITIGSRMLDQEAHRWHSLLQFRVRISDEESDQQSTMLLAMDQS